MADAPLSPPSPPADQPDQDVLPAKLHRPVLRANLVARPRLIERLIAGEQGRLTLLSAPPGFGKTTLLAAWAAAHEGPVAWLTLDEQDGPRRLLRGLATALDLAAPGAGGPLAAALADPAQHDAELGLSRLGHALAGLPAGMLIVLDDHHTLRGLASSRMTAALLDQLPPHTHLAIATRESPALPLARLRARGQITELRSGDLHFTLAEATAFLTTVMGLPLAPDAVAALARSTEGWPAALQLAALSLRDRDPAELDRLVGEAVGSNRFIVDYTASEVMRGLPSHLRSFLLQTSVLDRMCGPLCDAVLGLTPEGGARREAAPADSYSRLTLEELERLNMFLVPLDAEGVWWRYHHLFREVLRARLAAGVAPTVIAGLHERAAAWLGARGLAAEAAAHERAASSQPQPAGSQRATPEPEVSRLPPLAAGFVGRAREIEAVAAAFADPSCRLLTLVGPGGIGKTRLALEAAAACRARFAHGAALVSLAPVASAGHLAEAIVTALGLGLAGSADPAEQLLRALRERDLLLVLDNMEHLLDGAELVVGLLRGAPGLRVLATSREPLRVQDEVVLPLEGLPVAGENDAGAVELFVRRARRASPGFAPSPEELAAIGAICRAVEGAPLAIELAAAWVRTLSCAEIARELQQSHALLIATARDVPARHRSLQATFDHSWQLLSADEQRALGRLAVFRGGCTREAAAAVIGVSPAAALLTLTALCDKSLLRLARDGSQVARYDLHELVRQYVAARLAEHPAEEEDARRRHALHFADCIEGQGLALKSPRQKAAIATITAELDNLRAAWDWACGQQDVAVLRRIALPIHWFYEVRGLFHAAGTQFAHGRNALRPFADASGSPAAAYWTLVVFAAWHRMRYEPAWAVEQLGEALARLRHLDDHDPLLHCLVGLAYIVTFAGEYASATALLDEAQQCSDANGDRWGASVVAFVRSILECFRSDAATARKLIATSLVTCRAVGDPRHVGLLLNYLGTTALTLGQLDEAERACRESLTLSTEHQDDYQTSLALQSLGRVAIARGDTAAGRALLDRSLALARDIGDRWLEAQALGRLGGLAAVQGDLAGGRALLRSAVASAAGAPPPIALDELVALADVELGGPSGDAALVALAYAARHPLARAEARSLAAGCLHDAGPAQAEAAGVVAAPLAAEPPAALLRLFDDGAFRLTAPPPGVTQPAPAALPPTAPAPSGLVEPLTPREVEVLQLLAVGYANQGIADRLVIAIGTVKRHLHTIFEKLGVQSRTQALARARELGLI